MMLRGNSRGLLGVLLMAAMACATTGTASGAESQAVTVKIPQAIQWFMRDAYPKALAYQKEQAEDSSFHPEFSLVLYSRLPDTPWLVVLRVGREGQESVGVDRIVLVNDDGEVKAELPEAGRVHAGFMLSLGQGKAACVIGSAGGRHSSGWVLLYALDEPTKEMFRFPAEDTLRSDGVLYFVDTDDDGMKDILVDRDVYSEKDNKWTASPTAFRYDPEAGTFRPSNMDPEELKARIMGARQNVGLEQTAAYGAPRAIR